MGFPNPTSLTRSVLFFCDGRPGSRPGGLHAAANTSVAREYHAGLAAMLGAGLSYWYAQTSRAGLLLAIACLVLNWFGDSLDGTLAQFRNKQRPKYGFYVDHIVDALGTFFLLAGLGFSASSPNVWMASVLRWTHSIRSTASVR